MKTKVQMLLPALLGAVGFLLRWVQQGVFDPVTGLARKNAPISWVMALYLAAVAAGWLALALRGGNGRALTMEGAFRTPGQSMLMPVVCAAMLVVAGGGLLVMEGVQIGPVSTIVLGGLAVAAGGSLLFAVMRWRRDESCDALLTVPVVFAVAWALLTYRGYADHPVQARFYVQVLAIAAITYAFYQVAACANGQGRRRRLRAVLPMAIVLGLTALADDLPLGVMALYVGCTVLLSAFWICERERENRAEKGEQL